MKFTTILISATLTTVLAASFALLSSTENHSTTPLDIKYSTTDLEAMEELQFIETEDEQAISTTQPTPENLAIEDLSEEAETTTQDTQDIPEWLEKIKPKGDKFFEEKGLKNIEAEYISQSLKELEAEAVQEEFTEQDFSKIIESIKKSEGEDYFLGDMSDMAEVVEKVQESLPEKYDFLPE